MLTKNLRTLFNIDKEDFRLFPDSELYDQAKGILAAYINQLPELINKYGQDSDYVKGQISKLEEMRKALLDQEPSYGDRAEREIELNAKHKNGTWINQVYLAAPLTDLLDDADFEELIDYHKDNVFNLIQYPLNTSHANSMLMGQSKKKLLLCCIKPKYRSQIIKSISAGNYTGIILVNDKRIHWIWNARIYLHDDRGHTEVLFKQLSKRTQRRILRQLTTEPYQFGSFLEYFPQGVDYAK